MSRKLVWSFAIVAVASFIAIVQAQDSGQFEPTPATPPSSSSRIATRPSSSNSVSNGTRSRSSLVDRLKSIRQGGGTPETNPAPSRSSQTTTPQPEIPTAPSGNSILLKPSSTGRMQTGTTSKNNLNSGLRSTTTLTRQNDELKTITKSPITSSPRTAQRLTTSVTNSASTQSSSRRPREITPIDRSVIPKASSAKPQPSVQNTVQSKNRLATRPEPPVKRAPDDIALVSRGPALRVDTTGPKAITIGKAATYMVRVSNLNDDVAREVMVALNIPEWVNITGNRASSGSVRQPTGNSTPARIIWAIDRLAGRSSSDLSINVVTNENRPIDVVVDWAYRPESVSTRISVQEPRLELALAGPVDVLFGESPVYTITVSNPGTGDAENVAVNLPAELGGGQRAVGTILAGQTQQFEAQLVTKQAGELGLRATAVGDGSLTSEAVQRILIRRANLVVQAGGPKFKYAGSVAKFQLRVANEGDAIAEDVIAAVALPAGAKYLGGLQGAEAVDNGMRWPIGALNPGSEKFYEVTCQLNQAGNAEFQAGARAAGDLAGAAAATTTVEALADLKLMVNDPQGPKPVGEDVVYEIHVVNRGTKAANNVNVVVQFSEGVEPVNVSGVRGELVPGQVIFEPIAQIEAGAEISFSVTARAEQAGNHIYRTVLNCSEPETRRVSEGTTKFFGEQAATTANRSTFEAPR